jgi:hypothetical protein
MQHAVKVPVAPARRYLKRQCSLFIVSKQSSVVATTGIAAEVEMNNNSPTTDEKCKGALCGELSQLTDRFLIDQRNPC